MASGKLFGLLAMAFCAVCSLQIDSVHGQKQPRLEILPIQSVQRKPVGKSLMLTCRPNVPDATLVADLQWRDFLNNTVKPKPFGQLAPPMYTETLPGDQSLALLITSLTEGMAGMYYCSASYANTEQLEIAVKVETYVAITWKNAPENQYPTAGSRYMVRCEVTANPAPTVDWLRNGDPIKSGGRYVLDANGLLIQDVNESDDGIYTCRAAVVDTGELVERNIRVEVQILPQITTLPMELEAVEGQSFSVQCNATGKPVPRFNWIKDSSQQNVETADRFLVDPITGRMTITQVSKDDYGTYTCIAKNAAGTEQKRTMLNVLVRPRIYELLNITMAEDREAVLVCKATGRPAPEITFRRWGSSEELVNGPQPADDRIQLEQRFDESLGESAGTLRITKLMRSDDGLYECVARNRGEQAFRVGHITVEYKPSFEHMKNLPPVFSWDERRANLSCLAQGFPNATIEWRWNDRLIKDLADGNLQVEGNGPRSDLLVTPRDQRYYTAYKCIASNRLGRVEHLMHLRHARVPDIIPQARPSIVTATTISFNVIQPATEPGLPLTAITVQFKEATQPDWVYGYNRTWSPDSLYIVENLRPQTMYQFRFAARNMVGLGQWGAMEQLATPRRSVPESPRILLSSLSQDDSGSTESDEKTDRIYVSPYSDHIELSWSVPADNGEPIKSYQVRYCPGQKTNGAWHELEDTCVTRDVLNSDNSNFVMGQLKGDTYYRIELKAYNAIGFSQPAVLLMRTAQGSDQVMRVETPVLSSAAIVGISIAIVLLLLICIDILCCLLINAGILAMLCRRTKRSPSELDDETKIGSLYGWRFPLPYCSGQLVKEPPPSPSPLPPPVKLGSTPLTTPEDEREPLSNAEGSLLKNSRVESDGRVVISKSGEIIGKNSSV